MKLTQHTDYALRMLIFLAVHRDRSVTVSDVATSYGLSRNHLLKVAQNLGKRGYINTARGRSGGISLALPPDEINIGEVVRAMEDGFTLVECLHPEGGACILSPACRLKGVVREAIDAFLGVFDAYSLDDLVGNTKLLIELLRLPGGQAETISEGL